MTEDQIHQLVDQGMIPAGQKCQNLISTHISWVILCQDYVYKIKKPLHLSFVDFSTLEKREYFCKQELALNQRLVANMYLEVLPITFAHNIYSIGSKQGDVVDYALVMNRFDNTREMSKLLEKEKVKESDIMQIAWQLVDFHRRAQVVKGHVTPELLIKDFYDIEQIQPFVQEKIGESESHKLAEILSLARQFIDQQSEVIKQRDKEGFTRDCHGDLHSGNIFLLESPVIFDCIEFNEHLRWIDILNELAFFCMDLEFYHQNALSDYFMETYNQAFPVIRNDNEDRLFLFYKLYRANVKVKVNALKALQTEDPDESSSREKLFKEYFNLFLNYSSKLSLTLDGSL